LETRFNHFKHAQKKAQAQAQAVAINRALTSQADELALDLATQPQHRHTEKY